MEHADRLPTAFPWRTATLVVGVVAAIELAALVGIGATRLAAPLRAHVASTAHSAALAHAAQPTRKIASVATRPLRPRARLSVLVLNGNGVNGAAGTQATSLATLGYGAARSEDAPRHDYARSMVLYVPGYAAEARRLAHDARVGVVAPVDGAGKAALKGSTLVVVLGGS